MIGRRIKKLRKEEELTQGELAQNLGISVSAISNYESESRKPDHNMLCKIADYFDVSVDYLLGRTNIKNKEDNKTTKALEDNPELLKFWQEMQNRESLQLLFKQTRNLSDQAVKDVVRFMKSVEDEISNK